LLVSREWKKQAQLIRNPHGFQSVEPAELSR
jgi:hypothetical protein